MHETPTTDLLEQQFYSPCDATPYAPALPVVEIGAEDTAHPEGHDDYLDGRTGVIGTPADLGVGYDPSAADVVGPREPDIRSAAGAVIAAAGHESEVVVSGDDPVVSALHGGADAAHVEDADAELVADADGPGGPGKPPVPPTGGSGEAGAEPGDGEEPEGDRTPDVPAQPEVSPVGGAEGAPLVETTAEGRAVVPAEIAGHLKPLGIANEFLDGVGSEVGDFMKNPETVAEYRLNAVHSMAALAEMEHQALAAGERHTGVREETTYVGGEREQAGTYDISSYQGGRSPARHVVADYVERIDEESGELEYVVKVQPEVPEPDVPDGTGLMEAIRIQTAYEAEVAAAPEIIWESAKAHQVKIIHGGRSFTMDQLSDRQVIDTARFLRAAAVHAALARKDYATLEKLLPQDE